MIDVGIIVMRMESKEGLRFKMQFVELIKSIIDNTDSRMHFVLLTDPGKYIWKILIVCGYFKIFVFFSVSVTTLLRIMKKMTHVCKKNWRGCPTFEFFNVSTVTRQFQYEISHLKLYFTAKDAQVINNTQRF